MTAPENLSALRLPELRKMAQEKGIRGISSMRKGALIAAIEQASGAPQAANNGGEQPSAKAANAAAEPASRTRRSTRRVTKKSQELAEEQAHVEQQSGREEQPAQRAEASGEQATAAAAKENGKENSKENGAAAGEAAEQQEGSSDNTDGRPESRSAARRARRNRARHNARERQRGGDNNAAAATADNAAATGAGEPAGHEEEASAQPQQDNQREGQRDNEREGATGGSRGGRGNRDEDSDRRGRRSRRDRGRGRRDRDGGHGGEGDDSAAHNSDNLQPVAGILDIVDNNVAFVRTTGYQASPQDVFVSQQLIRRLGLRRGDAIVGQVKMGHEGHHGGRGNRGGNRQKYNNLVRVETINGMTVEEARQRPDFAKLTPLYPNQRLRLETQPNILTTRVIDLIMPIGKGQRALIVSPPKAGKTTILQNIANAIATNNPECYLMVVLVDERPEEVTDMERSVKGEVIASTFDRPPSEHTTVAELAIERAKRLVEQGQDVVVLLDSITRLGRAYNNSSPASGRILSGGVDSNALYPPKRFLGAARNIENGGSLTIIATAMVETGSAGDTVIFEEFKGTGNAELKLDRKISERRVFPAVDVNPSGTRKDELLLAPDEARVMHKLRRILSALDNQQAIDLLIKQLKKTKSNGEFLMQVQSSAPMAGLQQEEDYS